MPREILFYSDLHFGNQYPGVVELLSRFARRGYRVHYVEQLGIRNPHLRHLPRMVRGALGRSGQHSRAPFDVVSPKLLSPRRLPVVDTLNQAWLRRQLLCHVEDPADTIFWIRYPTPELVPLVEQMPWRLVVYELIDAHETSPGLPSRLRRIFAAAERRVLARAGVVFASSETVRARLAGLHPNVILAPAAAVDLEAFARAAPRRLAEGPVACYVGHFDKRLDCELMIGVTERLPGWTFVLAGRVSHRLGPRLVRLPNVVSLGTLPLADVPAVIAGANACLMPYRADGWADTLFPLKLIEYLAAGKPVVSTPIRAAREFADVVTLASDQAGFAEALEAAVATDSPDARRRRIERVDGFSWERRIDQMQNAIEAAAGRAHAA